MDISSLSPNCKKTIRIEPQFPLSWKQQYPLFCSCYTQTFLISSTCLHFLKSCGTKHRTKGLSHAGQVPYHWLTALTVDLSWGKNQIPIRGRSEPQDRNNFSAPASGAASFRGGTGINSFTSEGLQWTSLWLVWKTGAVFPLVVQKGWLWCLQFFARSQQPENRNQEPNWSLGYAPRT